MIITGQLIHEIYNKVIIEDAARNGWTHTPLSIKAWGNLREKEKRLYNNIADELNKKIEREQEASA
jgi:CRISPR/Cas system-associated exonuclease Cas4 (RecB family)